MKKCPFCGAEIEENARFCLYCMSSLEEKKYIKNTEKNKKRWPWILAAVFVCACICLLTYFLVQRNTGKTPLDSSQQAGESLPNDDEIPDDTPDDTPNDENADEPSDEPSAENPPPNDGPDLETPDNEDEGPTTPENPSTGPTITAPTYLYRDAKSGDDFAVHTDLENAVVIIGVSTPSSNGEYHIPETLDGKRVIAIATLAFCDDSIKDTVKKVIVPSSVKTIHEHAFSSCNNLTDIYFCGKAIYVYANAFAPLQNRIGALTIHCAYDCSDRNFRYYRNSASYYDALYEEWNG